MKVSQLIALSGILVAIPAVLAQPIAIDTLGPANGYNASAHHPIRGWTAAGGFQSNGYLFTAEASGTVKSITTAIEHVSGTNFYAMQIYTGNANGLGVEVGTWKGILAGTAADPITVVDEPSGSQPAVLVQGQTYWLLTIGEGDGIGRWFEREVPGTSTYWAQSSNASNWWLVNSTQFRAVRIVLEGEAECYANCDGSTTEPILNVDDFTCFINEFAVAQSLPHAEQVEHYANCDGSTTAPVLNVDDFTCFINAFAAGCP